ncbi:TOM1-like protein 2 isoform X1 [Diachasmimorpha longicaudata]|uniref:TOM1-like protein 2 isoform X1 n=1 Tax=Diachasmimorpha longicaudata TaxID=58733 RepID=UPI0030B8C809
MSFFGVNVNPFSTPVGQRIEQATDGSLPSENWALNMEICDIINETEDGPRDAIKAIKRRLTQAAGKNYTIVMYTLTVLETCVKNCGKRFHTLACSREFAGDLVKLIGPKNEPPTAVQEKVLSLIQTWADAFRHQPHTQGVVQVYQELKAKGIQFPMTDLDAMAPILTPERSVPEVTPAGPLSQERPASATDSAAIPIPPTAQPPVTSPIRLQDQHIAKLRSELEVVQGNMRVLAEMIQHLTEQCQNNQQPEQADLDLLHQLYSTCRAMQERVVELVGKLVDDEMTAELLRINDELNNLFLRYSRFTKNKAIPPASVILAQAIGHPPVGTEMTGKRSEPSLIDLGDGETAAGLDKQMSELEIKGDDTRTKTKDKDHPDNDEFDMFAQSRNATYETTKNSGSRYEDNMEELDSSISTALKNRNLNLGASGASNSVDSDVAAPTGVRTVLPSRESEFTEMAAWLDNTTAKEHTGDQESLTSSEFERFLAERAAAADALPNLPTVTTAPSTTTTGNTNIQRQINKDQDKSLFAL